MSKKTGVRDATTGWLEMLDRVNGVNEVKEVNEMTRRW
jgi:hypothetical protein